MQFYFQNLYLIENEAEVAFLACISAHLHTRKECSSSSVVFPFLPLMQTALTAIHCPKHMLLTHPKNFYTPPNLRL